MGATANTSINRVAHRVPATVDGMSTTRDPNTLDRHEFVRAGFSPSPVSRSAPHLAAAPAGRQAGARCEVHRIDPVNPYPYDYEETVERSVREQDADARPAIANPLASIDGYDIVLLGSPIWNVRAPMIMSTFAERYDFTGKTVFPFTTYAVSGLGTVVEDYGRLCPGASIGEGLAVRASE
jgi:flavodoxin